MLIQRFPYQKIERKTVDGSRLYFCPNGERLPSVTTILDKTKTEEKKQALNDWRKRVGHARAETITKEAGARGTRMHTYLENFMRIGESGVPGTNPFSKESHRMAEHVIKNGLSNVTEFYGSEVSLYYPSLYAGATDAVFLENGELTLGDFKQTNKPKKKEWIDSYFQQLSAYVLAHDVLYGTNINRAKILMCSPDLVYQEWTLEGNELESYKEKWWEALDKFYTEKFGL